MYFPLLRGKQYELIAVRELAGLSQLPSTTSFILEPVRTRGFTPLLRCTDALGSAGVGVAVILNPQVGELKTGTSSISSEISAAITTSNREVSSPGVALRIDSATDLERLQTSYFDSFSDGTPLTLIHDGYNEALSRDVVPAFAEVASVHVVRDQIRRRRLQNVMTGKTAVTLSDNFPSQVRNSDYLAVGESLFSEEHLFAAEEGWDGFSDYLTIGEGYSEGGFSPRAVAIHWTYEKSPGSAIFIRHFTSDSNADTSDVGGKFLEAANKLVRFLDDRQIFNTASNVMRSHVANETYPGLGIVKKLSVMNHIELVNGLLSR
jgi:hypothetical protein